MIALSGADLAITITRPHATRLLPVGVFMEKDSAAITQKAWRNLNITEKKLLKALTNKIFKKLQDTAKGVNACVKEGGRHVHYLLSLHVSTF
jgi:hypothetical protein